MRTPHRNATHTYSDLPGRKPRNPYEELAALDDGPLEPTPLEDFLRASFTGPLREGGSRTGASGGSPAGASGGSPAGASGGGSGSGLGDGDGDGHGPGSGPGVGPGAGPGGVVEEPPWAPPVHRRGGRRRRRGRLGRLPATAKALVVVATAAAFLVLADRWAVLYAEHRAARALEDRLGLAAEPEVEIDGFPFLTQLADRRLDTVRLTVPDVAADRVSLSRVSATAHDVRLEGDGPASVTGARLPRLDGEVLLSFEDLDRELGASQVTFTGAGRDRVVARGTLPVAGHEVRMRAEARIRQEGDRGLATEIGGMRLDIGDLATYRPGTGPGQGCT